MRNKGVIEIEKFQAGAETTVFQNVNSIKIRNYSITSIGRCGNEFAAFMKKILT